MYLRQWVDARRDQAEGPSRLLPADRVLMDCQMCVVLAGPGGGKSSLLRTRLATGVQHCATRTPEAASRSLRNLLRPRRGLLPGWATRYRVPRQVDVSYAGFLLEVAPAADSGAIASILARLASRSSMDGCALIADLALLSTSLPGHAVAIATQRFRSVADDPAAPPSRRVTSAEALISLVGPQGTDLLHKLASDSALQSGARTYAAQALVDRTDDRCPRCWKHWVPTAPSIRRPASGPRRNSWPLTELVEPHCWITSAGTPTSPERPARGRPRNYAHTTSPAASACCGSSPLPPPLIQTHRLQAATVLLETTGPDAADPLETLARDPRLDPAHRVRAAHAYVRVLGSGAVELLGALALDTTLVGYDRVWAAGTLAALDAEKGSTVLEALSQDGALHEDDRRWVNDSLARLDAEPATPPAL
ncbi:HEAT repeat domain-containing protein [Streptomyces hawaiiensis]|uniref:HEAT repeat domain-containing protein n=1 Tax=Streptomyces hawaiiensis TaxID=67305 RepID=UPI001585D8C1|nr:hypothetical protein [Streptomyces hawaiiensis]